MTLAREPNSASGAWFDTCQVLGWGTVADALDSPEATVRSWADATSDKYPPLWAVERADLMLKDAGHPPLNTIALGARIGERGAGPEHRLREVARELDVAAREVAEVPEWDFEAVVAALAKVTNRVGVVMHQTCARNGREGQRRPPKLRSVGG